jgi:hypothetical protein
MRARTLNLACARPKERPSLILVGFSSDSNTAPDRMEVRKTALPDQVPYKASAERIEET